MCALVIRDQMLQRVGGEQAVLSSGGDVELNSARRRESPPLFSPTSSADGDELLRSPTGSKRRRSNKRQSDVIEQIEKLAGSTSASEVDMRRLDFEMERFGKEMEFQRIRMEREFELRQQQEERAARAEERAIQELNLRVQSQAEARRESDREYEIKRQQLKLSIDQSERTAKQAERQMDLKMEKMKLMMSQFMASQASK